MKEYALYKGENLLAIGTGEEIAKRMGVKKETIAFYKTPAYRRRAKSKNVRILVPLDEAVAE